MRQQPLAAYLALRDRYGDVVRLQSRPQPLYLLSHPDAVQHVLRDHASNYRKGRLFEPIATLQGQGLLTSEGTLWRQQRRLLQPAFHPRHIALSSAIMVEEAQEVAQGWRQAARTGQPLDVNAWMHRLTFRVVGRALLGLSPEALDHLGRHLQTLAGPLMRHFSLGRQRWRRLSWLPTARRRRVHRAVAAYNTVVQHLIDSRRQAMRDSATPATDVLARLIAAHDDSAASTMSAQQLRDEVITLIGAGVETTALALSWTWYLLAVHPEVAHSVQAEFEAVLAGRPPGPDDLPQLPYSRMVLDETLRLYPPSALLPRQANADDLLGGFRIPRDAIVMLSQYVTHRHPDFWPEPERFGPERFTPDRVAARHRYAYFPFGAGPRGCIGKPFALLEMHLVLATLAPRYTLHLIPERPVTPVLATTLRPHRGLWMTVLER